MIEGKYTVQVTGTIRILISRPANRSPVWEQNVQFTATSGVPQEWDIKPFVRDPDGDPMTYALVTMTPALVQLGFSFNAETGIMLYNGTPMTFAEVFEGEVAFSANDNR